MILNDKIYNNCSLFGEPYTDDETSHDYNQIRIGMSGVIIGQGL